MDEVNGPGQYRFRATAAVLLLLATAGIAQGCSAEEQDASVDQRPVQHALDLQNGEALDEVKNKLGQPVTEFIDDDGNGTLNYPEWQIGFRDGELTYRFHEVGQRRVRRGDGERLRRQIVALERGMSVTQVETTLGKPDVLALHYGESKSPEKVLRYGPWELRFRQGRLWMRTHW